MPSGWFRFYDASSERFYYSNLKTKQSSWDRPDADPYFADEAVILEFSTLEIAHLKELYEEEVAHFEIVTIPRLHFILREIGHPLPMDLIRALCHSLELDAEDKQVRNDTRVGVRLYQDFMMFMVGVKNLVRERSWTRRVERLLNVPRAAYLKARAGLFTFRGRDALHWTTVHDPFVCRDYFYNTRTHQRQWHMPEELRFYLSPGLQRDLTVFTPGDLKQFRFRFACLDLDASGELDQTEIELLIGSLVSSGISKATLKRMIRDTDFDGSGTMQFDEFCALMLKIKIEVDKRKRAADKKSTREKEKEKGEKVESKQSKADTTTTTTTTSTSLQPTVVGFEGAFAEGEPNDGERQQQEDFNGHEGVTQERTDGGAVQGEIVVSECKSRSMSEENQMAGEQRTPADAELCQPCEAPPPTAGDMSGRPVTAGEGEEESFLAGGFVDMHAAQDAFAHLRPHTSEHGSRVEQTARVLTCVGRYLAAWACCRWPQPQVRDKKYDQRHDPFCMCGCHAPLEMPASY